MIVTTTQYQRSFTNSWAAVDEAIDKIPAGAVLDLQVTVPAYSEVYVTSFKLFKDTVQITLRYGEGLTLLGSINTAIDGMPKSLTCVDGFTANILLGSLNSDYEGELVQHPIKINPELVSVDDKYPVTGAHRLTVIQDGDTLLSGELTNDITLVRGSEVDYTIHEGVAMLRLVNTDIKTESVSPRTNARKIRTINGISGENLNITISVQGSDTGIITEQIGNSIYIDSTELAEKLKVIDPIDAAISPQPGRQYAYYPLDDAYITRDASGDYTVGTVRNVDDNITGTYILDYVGEGATGIWVSDISAIDTNYDIPED